MMTKNKQMNLSIKSDRTYSPSFILKSRSKNKFFSKKASIFTLLFIVLANILLVSAVVAIFTSYEHFPQSNSLSGLIYAQEHKAKRVVTEQQIILESNVLTFEEFKEALVYTTHADGRACVTHNRLHITCPQLENHFIAYQDARYKTMFQKSQNTQDLSVIDRSNSFAYNSNEFSSGYYLKLAKTDTSKDVETLTFAKNLLQTATQSGTQDQVFNAQNYVNYAEEQNAKTAISYNLNVMRFKPIRDIQIYEGELKLTVSGVLTDLILLKEPTLEEKFTWTSANEIRFFILPIANDQGFFYFQPIQTSIPISSQIGTAFVLHSVSESLTTKTYEILIPKLTQNWDTEFENHKDDLESELSILFNTTYASALGYDIQNKDDFTKAQNQTLDILERIEITSSQVTYYIKPSFVLEVTY
jgi:hypothetical protein